MMQEVLDGLSLDVTAGKIEQLKVLFPEVFTEGKIDFKRLRDVLGDTVNFANEHYELSWAGKAEARKEVQKQTTATLLPGRESSIDFDNTENMFIEGENLEVLRVLQKSYFGKIKMIYIDPPYNTGNDSFVYPDDYTERQDEYNRRTGITNEEGFLNKQDLWKKNSKENGRFHSVWLSMMYPRLYLARNLLREDGVIFVSIDDNEVYNLRLLLNEIFGEENFLGSIIWKKKTNGNNMGYIPPVHDCFLVYAKQSTALNENEFGFPLSQEYVNKNYSNPDNDPRGLWNTMDLSANHKGPHFPIVNPKTGAVHYPALGRYWVFNEKDVENRIKDGRIIFGKSGNGKPVQKVFLKEKVEKRAKAESWWDKHGINADGTTELTDLFDVPKIFSHSKPSVTIKHLINISTSINNSDIILDFFAGSATTAHSVLELNKEDNGNRKFILVQLPETVEENSEAFKAGYKTIADISKARIKKVIQKLQKEKEGQIDFEETKQPLGFQSYKLAPSNFEIWRNDIQGKEAILQQLEMFANSTKPGTNKKAMLTELLLKAGKPLTTKVQTQKTTEGCFYLLPEHSVCICLQAFGTDTRNKIYELQPKEVIILNSLFESDEFLSNTKLEFTEAGIKLTLI